MAGGHRSGVELRQVTKRYGDRVVLHELELTLSPAQSVTVEGANGSGKSTLLRLIAGITRPTSGSVHGVPDRVGYLAERFSPPPLMRADAYLRHLGRIAGLSGRAAGARADALLELLMIKPGPRHRLGTLSKGNLQKVGLAQVFLADHALVVLDEPRTGLESSAWPALGRLVADQVSRGGLVICSEHDPTVLAGATNRVRVREGGAGVVQTSATAAAADPPHFRVRACRLSDDALGAAALVAAVPAAVVEDDDGGGLLSLRLPAHAKDPVLLWLLGNGWTVTAVELDERV